MRNTYGWFMVGVSMLLLLLTVGPTSYAFGLFVLPVSEDLGLSRADINTGLILLNFGMAALAPFVGRLLDRTSIRLTMGLSAALMARVRACTVSVTVAVRHSPAVSQAS